VPVALEYVSTATIYRYYQHCSQVIAAYAEGYTYGTKSFTTQIYKGHWQVVDKSKW
jgi:hypothetical protein